MRERIGRFRDGAARRAFVGRYERAVRTHWPVQCEELDVETRFGVTHVRRSGRGLGPVLVLLHPHMGTSVAWYRLAGLFDGGRRVVAVDTIGALGLSVQTAPITGPGDYGLWVRDVLDGLGLAERAHLVGYSEGGYVAMCAALGGSDRLGSVVAIEPGGAIARVRTRFLAAMVWAGLRAQFDRDTLRAFGERLSPGIDLADDVWDMAITGACGFRPGLPPPKRFTDAQLRSIRTPTLLYMAADTELYDPIAAARRAGALLPDVETVVVDGAQHGLPYQFPELTTAAVIAFVDRHHHAQTSKP
jgi:pimeloyl-ACP methyl ester carboxylesterase